MELGLHGKVVVITGGNDGIGKAAALGFAREGCKVAVCGRNAAKTAAVVDEFRRQGLSLLGLTADVSDGRQLQELADTVARELGPADVWINNAGIYPQRALLDMTEAEWDEIMAINLKSVWMGCKIAAQQMRDRGGVILNAASFAAIIPSAGSGAYAASKAGVLSLTRVFAAELAPYGIRVNAYIPGVIDTQMTRPGIEARGPAMLDQIALRRFGEPEECVGALLYLASDQARYVTGTSIEISGGKFIVQNPAAPWAGR